MGQCYHSAVVVLKCGTKVSTDNSFAPHSISVESCIDRRQTYGVWDGWNTNEHHKPMHDHIIMVSVPHLLSVVQPPLDTAKSKAAKQGRFPRCSPRIDEQLSQNQPNRVCSFLNSWNFPEHDPGSRTPSHSTGARGLVCTDGLKQTHSMEQCRVLPILSFMLPPEFSEVLRHRIAPPNRLAGHKLYFVDPRLADKCCGVGNLSY